MKRRRYKQEVAGKRGWSRWIFPIHGMGNKNYRLACCDCHLVHDMQFRVVNIAGKDKVSFKVKINKRATAAMRRDR